MDVEAVVAYWLKSANEDRKTARSLFRSRRYHHCLFFCHLFIEKALKAVLVRETGKPAPFGHKLSRLAGASTRLKLSDDEKELLDEVTAFNIEARYDDFKFEFIRKATRRYAEKYFIRTERLFRWLKKDASA
jgi:HEPN domain-containing protein